MSAKDEFIKTVTDFMKGKTGPPDMEVAELSITGEISPDMVRPTKLSSTYGEFENEYSAITSDLSKCSLKHCLAILGSMLTLPEFQSNSYRLEILVHLAFLGAKGKARPTPAQIVAWFDQLDNGTCGWQEDPAEDVFLSKVTVESKDYRLFEGSAEGNSFHTQLFLSIFEDMPDNDSYLSLKRAVMSLLRISDEIVERTDAQVYCVGNLTPISNIKPPPKSLWSELLERVTLTYDELEQIGVDTDSLESFLIRPNDIENLRAFRPGHSPLDFKPIYRTPKGLIMFQPNLIGTAIRCFLITSCINAGMGENLHRALANAYAAHFTKEKLFLGLPTPRLDFQHYGSFYISNAVKEIDTGRYLHLLFFVDGFKDFEQGRFIGINPIREISEYVKKSTDYVQKKYSAKKGFREGLTLVICCGWGRYMGLGLEKNWAGWRTTMIPAHDITTLSRTPSFQSLDILRVLDAEDTLKNINIKLNNVNGFLNLFAWINSNNGHIFPHEKMGDGLLNGGEFSIPLNCNLRLRHNAYLATDIRTLPRPDGSIARLRRMHGTPRFGTKEFSPFYVDIDAMEYRMLRSVYIGKRGVYWTEAKTAPELNAEIRFQLIEMIMVWSELVFQYFDEREHTNDNVCVSCCFHFLNCKIPDEIDSEPNDEETSLLVERIHQDDSRTIAFNVKEGFFSASQRHDNLAERTIVRAIVESCFEAFTEDPSDDEVDSAINAVVKTDIARHVHVFPDLLPRDFIREDLPEKVQIIERMDDANIRLGLGWICRNRSEGGEIRGLEECKNYLAKLRRALIKKYKDNIARFDKQTLVEQLLRNHEASLYEVDRWHRTYGAVVALSSDEALATGDALQDIKHYNATSVCSRIAIEAAICECPLNGGLKPGDYDIAQLLAHASMIHHIGLYPVAMSAGMMECRIKISPAGELMMNHNFSDEVVEPYGEFIQTKILKNTTQEYLENYVMAANTKTTKQSGKVPSDFDFQEFKQAWYEEYGFTLENLQTFINGIGSMLMKSPKAVLQIKRSNMVTKICREVDISSEIVTACIESFSSIPRDKWDVSPDGYMDSAWYPWLFRRQLSLVSKPIIQLNNADDPDCLIAPAMIMQFISKFVSDAGQGALDNKMFQKKGSMSRWIGKASNIHGKAFNDEAAAKFRSIGWNAQENLSDGKILGKKKSQCFGDVDILAWNEAQKRVLVVECKNLLFEKTLKEIVDHLAKFRGKTKDDNKTDYLKKHIERCEVIEANIDQLSKFVKFKVKRIDRVLMFSKPAPIQFLDINTKFSITMCTLDEIEEKFGIN